MNNSRTTTRGTRLQGDGGAVLVEAAFFFPLLVMLLAGLVDFGVGYRERTNMQGALRSAGRVAAAEQNTGDADKAILTALNASLGQHPNFAVQKVIIYLTSATANGAITATCAGTAPSGGGAGQNTTSAGFCNVYSDSQMRNAATAGSFTSGGTPVPASCGANWDHYWCPLTRKVLFTDNGGGTLQDLGPDYLGIYIQAIYTPFTKIFKSSITMTDTIVVRLEPNP